MNRGFTLIEILVTVAIFSAVVFVMSGFVKNTLDFNREASSNLNLELKARQALNLMIFELRSATSIDEHATSSIALSLDLDADDVVESIFYSLNSEGELIREVGGEERVLVSGLLNDSLNPVFEYLGRFVRVNLILEGRTLMSGATVRNLMEDL